jgi:hypothetical protein
MGRVRSLGWFLDGGLIGTVAWLIVLSTVAGFLLTGRVQSVHEFHGSHDLLALDHAADFVVGVSVNVNEDREPLAVEVSKFGPVEQIEFSHPWQ